MSRCRFDAGKCVQCHRLIHHYVDGAIPQCNFTVLLCVRVRLLGFCPFNLLLFGSSQYHYQSHLLGASKSETRKRLGDQCRRCRRYIRFGPAPPSTRNNKMYIHLGCKCFLDWKRFLFFVRSVVVVGVGVGVLSLTLFANFSLFIPFFMAWITTKINAIANKRIFTCQIIVCWARESETDRHVHTSFVAGDGWSGVTTTTEQMCITKTTLVNSPLSAINFAVYFRLVAVVVLPLINR